MINFKMGHKTGQDRYFKVIYINEKLENTKKINKQHTYIYIQLLKTCPVLSFCPFYIIYTIYNKK